MIPVEFLQTPDICATHMYFWHICKTYLCSALSTKIVFFMSRHDCPKTFCDINKAPSSCNVYWKLLNFRMCGLRDIIEEFLQGLEELKHMLNIEKVVIEFLYCQKFWSNMPDLNLWLVLVWIGWCVFGARRCAAISAGKLFPDPFEKGGA